MEMVNIQNAKTHLSRLVDQAAAGAEIVIAKAGKPLVKLTPFHPNSNARTLGALQGQVQESHDCWTSDPELDAAFYGDDAEPALRIAEDAP
jgi:prevent-host-death family protein